MREALSRCTLEFPHMFLIHRPALATFHSHILFLCLVACTSMVGWKACSPASEDVTRARSGVGTRGRACATDLMKSRWKTPADGLSSFECGSDVGR